MIVPSKALIAYINAFESRDEFCRRFDIDQNTVRRYLEFQQTCASAFIEKVKEMTGLDFEKAFSITEEPDEREKH